MSRSTVPNLPPPPAYSYQEAHITDFTGGLNRGATPFAIRDNQATSLKNVDAHNYPALSTMLGRTAVGSSLGAEPSFIAPYLKSNGFYELLAMAGGKVYKWSGSAWVEIASGYSTVPADAITFPSQDLFIFSNGVDNPTKYDGTTFSNLGGSPPKMKGLVVHKNRVFGWGVPNYPVNLYYSNVSNCEDWTTLGATGWQGFETADGTPITGALSFGDLLVFKPKHVFALLGSSPPFQRVTVSEVTGTSHRRSIAVAGRYAFWLGSDGVYRYAKGLAPENIADATIKPIIADIDYNSVSKIAAMTDGVRYYLSLPCLSGDKTIEWDTRFDSWYVRDGVTFSCGFLWKRPA